jgi:DNA-binding NarL/FixJ family response regulator
VFTNAGQAECRVGCPLEGLRRSAPGVTAEKIERGAAKFTPREEQLLNELIHGAGDSNKDIARAMGTTEGTIKVYLCQLGKKIHGGRSISRVALALWAERRWQDQSG